MSVFQRLRENSEWKRSTTCIFVFAATRNDFLTTFKGSRSALATSEKNNPSAGLNVPMDSNPTSIHILLADDDEDDRFLFKELLTKYSSSVFLMTAEDGEKLMDMLSALPSSPPPHLIFLDINMPRKNGIECLAEIRSNKKFDDVPVFMFSTSSHKHDIDVTYKKGANLYIPKSLFFTDQKQIIEKLFSGHWKNYLSKIPKEKFVLNSDSL